MYKKEEKLILNHLVGITEEVYKILRLNKKREKISMAKIICNLVLEKYGTTNKLQK